MSKLRKKLMKQAAGEFNYNENLYNSIETGDGSHPELKDEVIQELFGSLNIDMDIDNDTDVDGNSITGGSVTGTVDLNILSSTYGEVSEDDKSAIEDFFHNYDENAVLKDELNMLVDEAVGSTAGNPSFSTSASVQGNTLKVTVEIDTEYTA